MKKRSALIFGVALLVLSAGTAKAALVKWVLNDFVFVDGATATGSFMYDAGSNLFSGIQIQTTTPGGGGTLPSPPFVRNYITTGLGPPPTSDHISFHTNPPPVTPGTDTRFEIVLVSDMTDAGGILFPDFFQESTLCSASGTCNGGPARTGLGVVGPAPFISGTVVPLPPTLLLFGSGLMALFGWLGIGRRRQTAEAV